MPNNIDFTEVENVKTIEVNPPGWISPLYVEYGIGADIKYYGTRSYFWRVKGTEHCFIIPTVRLDFLSSGNYKKHFEDALETFLQDYISWKNEGFSTEWARDYERQFSKFVVI